MFAEESIQGALLVRTNRHAVKFEGLMQFVQVDVLGSRKSRGRIGGKVDVASDRSQVVNIAHLLTRDYLDRERVAVIELDIEGRVWTKGVSSNDARAS